MTHIFISCSKQNEQREQYKLAIMQMGVVAVFVLCNFLAMVSNILEMCSIEAFSVITVSNLLVTINSSINLFVYCAFRERFRTELKRMICELMRGVTKYFTSNIKIQSQKSIASIKVNHLKSQLRRNRSQSLPGLSPPFSSHAYKSNDLPLVTFEASSFLSRYKFFEIENIETQSMLNGIQ